MVYLEEINNVDIDDDERFVDEMNDTVTHGDVGFDHLGYHYTPRVMEITHQGVGLHVDCADTIRKPSSKDRERGGKMAIKKNVQTLDRETLGNKIPRDPVSCDGRDSLLKETVTFKLSEKASVCTGRPLMAGRVNKATFGTMCPSITLGSILSRDTAYFLKKGNLKFWPLKRYSWKLEKNLFSQRKKGLGVFQLSWQIWIQYLPRHTGRIRGKRLKNWIESTSRACQLLNQCAYDNRVWSMIAVTGTCWSGTAFLVRSDGNGGGSRSSFSDHKNEQ